MAEPATPGPRGRAPALSSEQARDLLRVAHAAAQLAYCPYSRARIGAALLTEDGEVFAGCNVENASYGLSQCAERVALAKAVSAGARHFQALAIASSRAQPPLPCGACRQVLREFAEDLAIVTQGAEGEAVEARLAELLPRPFTGRDVV